MEPSRPLDQQQSAWRPLLRPARKHEAPGLRAQTPGAMDANNSLGSPFHATLACLRPARLPRAKWPSF